MGDGSRSRMFLFCGKLSLTNSMVMHRTKYITFLELQREYRRMLMGWWQGVFVAVVAGRHQHVFCFLLRQGLNGPAVFGRRE